MELFDKPISALPEDAPSGCSLARCIMFYDWDLDIDFQWLDWIEIVFSEFGLEPVEGTSHAGGEHSHGNYRRVKNRIQKILRRPADISKGVRVRSQPSDSKNAFFPCPMTIEVCIDALGVNSGLIAIDENYVSSIEALLDRVEKQIFLSVGPVYASAFDFPSIYGPNAYLVGMGAVPSGFSSLANREYSSRITRWRDRVRSLELRPNRGYIREVYPVNFILDTHLQMPFEGHPLSDFIEKVGTLTPLSFCNGLYRWDVPSDELESVRRRLEPAGLVLSAVADPLLRSA